MKISDYLDREEIAAFTAKSDVQAWRLVIANWLAIAAIFAVVGRYPNPLTILLAIPLLAGRQLGLAVLTHEAGHRTLFRTSWLNDVVGQWLCALPVFNDMPSYARGHLSHHQKAGTREDPDLPNYATYPVSRESFRRKVVRDLTGQTGIKFLGAIMRGAAGVTSREQRDSALPFIQQLCMQLVLFLILALCGIGWAYLLWLGAFSCLLSA